MAKLSRRKTKPRRVVLQRKTTEVTISVDFNIDGSGKTDIQTGFEPLSHLLTLFAFHGLFDLKLSAQGDLEHHIIEDIGIVLGKAFRDSLGDMSGINRYGSFSATMDKVVVEADIDLSGRPSMHREVSAGNKTKVENILTHETFDNTDFNFKHAEEFLGAFVQHAGISFVYNIKSGEGDLHHLLEALFKALGKALDQATQIDPRRHGVPSTKGVID